jgi:hypothetical protein
MTASDWKELMGRLAAPFASTQFKIQVFNKERSRCYVVGVCDRVQVIERLNDVAPGEWSWEIVEESPREWMEREAGSWKKAAGFSVRGRLTIYGVSRDEEGMARDTDPDPMKSAASDALKRAATMFGVGMYLQHLEGEWLDYDAAGGKPLAAPSWAGEPMPTPQEARAKQGPKPSPSARPEGDATPRGLCPSHGVPFEHKTGARKDGSTFDFWGCPQFSLVEEGGRKRRQYCQERPPEEATDQQSAEEAEPNGGGHAGMLTVEEAVRLGACQMCGGPVSLAIIKVSSGSAWQERFRHLNGEPCAAGEGAPCGPLCDADKARFAVAG